MGVGLGQYNGYLGPIQQSWKVKYSPTTGGESSITSFGFDAAQMANIAAIQAAAGISCDLSFEHNMAKLVLTTTNPTYQGFGSVFNAIIDKWEVSVDEERPDLFENQYFLSLFDQANLDYGTNVDQQFAQLIKNTIEKGQDTNSQWGDFVDNLNQVDMYAPNGNIIAPGNEVLYNSALLEAFDNLPDPTFPVKPATGSGALQFFFNEYARGRTNYLHSKYTLKHTTCCPDTYSSDVAEFNIEEIYSISQLLSEVQNATLWILPLPNYLAYKILSYPIPINMPPNYAFGALKLRSNAVVAARGRIEITQSYLIDAIAVPTYGLI